MFAIRNASRNGLYLSSQAGQCRTALVTRPRNRVSLAEKIVHGVLIACGILATPAWVTTHFREYSGRDTK